MTDSHSDRSGRQTAPEKDLRLTFGICAHMHILTPFPNSTLKNVKALDGLAEFQVVKHLVPPLYDSKTWVMVVFDGRTPIHGCPWTDPQSTLKSLVGSSLLPLVLEVTIL